MTLTYINSQGQTFDFFASNIYRVKKANFHRYAWKYSGIEQQFGVSVSQFQKDPYEYDAVISVKGTLEERKAFLNAFHEAAAYDVINRSVGKLWWNDFYLECFITSTSTYPSEEDSSTINEIVIFAPYPFWVQTISKEFYLAQGETSSDGLDFPFDFPFDFAGGFSGSSTFDADHYVPCDFELTIYGPCTDPRVLIDNHPYQVFVTLATGEYLKINSQKKTVIRYTITGNKINVYNARQMEPSVFDKIPGNQVPVVWSGLFGFTITAYKERGEPEWT